jgi:hypothetical protein
LIAMRRMLTVFQQAFHGTPARLFYASDYVPPEGDTEETAYLKHVRELCLKKLSEGDGIML